MIANLKNGFCCFYDGFTEIEALKGFLEVVNPILEVSFRIELLPAVAVIHYLDEIACAGSNTCSERFLLVVLDANAKLYGIEISPSDHLNISITRPQR